MMALFDEDYIQRAYGRECELRGEARGRKQGQAEMMSVMQKLFAAGRIEDAKRATTDMAFFNQIKKEFAQ